MNALLQVAVILGLVSLCMTRDTTTAAACKYEFTVPTGVCLDNNKALDSTVETIKTDIDNMKLQYVAQNSQIQNALQQTQSDANSYLTKIRDLQQEFLVVKQTVATLPVSGTGSGGNLAKIITDMKSLLTQSFLDIQYKVDNISNEYQQMAVQKSKLHSAIEARIHSQEMSIRSMQKNIADIETKVKNFNGSFGHPTASPTSSPSNNNMSSFYSHMLSSLKQQFGTMQRQVQKLEQKIQSQNQSIQAANQKFEQELTAQANESNFLKNATQEFDNRIKQTENMTTQIQAKVTILESNFTNQFDALKQGLNGTKSKFDHLYANMTGIGKELNLIKGDNAVTQLILEQMRNNTQRVNDLVKSVSQENAMNGGNLTQMMLDMVRMKNLVHPPSGAPMTLLGVSSMFTQFKTQAQQDISKSERNILQLKMMMHAMNTTLVSKLHIASG